MYKDDMMNGNGKYSYDNGNVYDGNYEDDISMMNGYEIVTFANGDVNNGNYKYEVYNCNTQYEFTINDTFGDGICCGFGAGEYEVLRRMMW